MSQAGVVNSSGTTPPPTVLQTVTTQDGTATVAANNLNYNGYPQSPADPQIGITHASGSTFTYEDRTWLTQFVVDPSATIGTRGTFQTIGAAYASAVSSGISDPSIFIRNGVYTENLTLTTPVDFIAFDTSDRDSFQAVELIGKVTISTAAGKVSFNGMRLTTNTDNFLNVSGISQVTYNGCYFNCSNANGIVFNAGNTSNLYLENCGGNIANTFYLMNITNSVAWIKNCNIYDNGGSPAQSISNEARIIIQSSLLRIPFITAAGGSIQATNTSFGTIASPFDNYTYLTTVGTGTSYLESCQVYSGTASCVSVGTGTSAIIFSCDLNSNNTNVVTGIGTVKMAGTLFTGTSSLVNTTNQTGGVLQGFRVAPPAGFIGEKIAANLVKASATALVSLTPKTVISINLTPGVWDVSGICCFQGVTTGTQVRASISVTTNTESGLPGVSQVSFPFLTQAAEDLTLTIPSFRVVLTTTTTYFLVALEVYTVGTGTAYGSIYGTRVG